MEKSLLDRLNSINDRVSDSPEKNTETENCKNNENKSLEEYIDSKRINIYSRNWNKLEYKLKRNKIEEFILNDIKNEKVNEKSGNKMKNILIRLLRRDKLNKSNDLDYNQKSCLIESIKNLDYEDEAEDENKNICYIWKNEVIN